MMIRFCTFAALLAACAVRGWAQEPADFRVPPYVQHPTADGMTVIWFSERPEAGELTYTRESGGEESVRVSSPVLAEALAHPAWEGQFFTDQLPPPPYRHRVRLTGLEPGTTYSYTVAQGAARFSASFRTAPGAEQPVRLIVYADSETEPESTGVRRAWADPSGSDLGRMYLLDQTVGYANNLAVIASRNPDLVAIAGDLVESGGEQRDWDEFWRHAGDVDGGSSLAGRVPLLASPGNHEYYEGPGLGRYDQPGSERAINRFRAYFEFPPNGSPDEEQEGRYFRLDYGPITLIGLDLANGSSHQSDGDTNFYLLGESDAGGGHAPAFGPDSRQYAWLEDQLREAQRRSRFTFVMFHHIPYSVGPHGWPAGDGSGLDNQSGVPVRVLTPLFMRYGVDAVLAGHDEIWERSEIEGTEILTDGTEGAHTIHVYDVGTGGDGLRGPQAGLENPHQAFIVHRDVPEVWDGEVLTEGGKHYGHLEVNVTPRLDGGWQAEMVPVYVFPLMSAEGAPVGFERRVYDDVITLVAGDAETGVLDSAASVPRSLEIYQNYPNPFNSSTVLRFGLPREAEVELAVYDLAGQRVVELVRGRRAAGAYSLRWDGRDGRGRELATGVYLYRLRADAEVVATRKMVLMR